MTVCDSWTWTRRFFVVSAVISYVTGAGSLTAQAAEDTYERPPLFKASDLLPADLLRGDLHRILETVENDGFENRYIIESEFGTITAHRTDFVAERVQEVYAIAELNKVTRSEAFAQGVAQAATSPFRALKSLATEPVGTVTGAVRGVGALFSQAGEMLTGSRGELEGSAASELVGFGEVKRSIADLLKIDPYTTNPVLQDGMNEVAWAGFAGGLSLAPLSVGGSVGTALSGIQNARTLNSLLTVQSPAALSTLNRERLTAMDIEAAPIEGFVEHAWLSPRHETTITASLMGLEDTENRTAFLTQAMTSENEVQSVFLMRQAEAILGFHQNVSPVKRMERVDQTLVLITTDDRVVTVVPADHLTWTAASQVLTTQTVENDNPHELWLTGSISDQARANFENLGWRVMAEEATRLAPDLNTVLEGNSESLDQGGEGSEDSGAADQEQAG